MNGMIYEHTPLSNQHPKVLRTVLQAFDLQKDVHILTFGNGLINYTWKVVDNEQEYILQKVNHQVFVKPENISYNIRLLANYIDKYAPDYLFVKPIPANNGSDLVQINEAGFFRLFPFINNSYTKTVADTPEQAFEAAKQFGKFTRLFSGFDARQLKTTIPDFHNLSLRYQQFLTAIENGNKERIIKSQELIQQLNSYSEIVHQYQGIKTNPAFKLRVTHHDTKISNVLFNAHDKGICVIDLDTVMPGYFISDVGDMIRTYLSPQSEEETDTKKIEVREEFYKALVEGYYSEMKDELSAVEKSYFFYAGKYIIYMQALRFLTDHLNNDIYYGSRYENHNLVRATNQTVLLQQFLKKQDVLENTFVF